MRRTQRVRSYESLGHCIVGLVLLVFAAGCRRQPSIDLSATAVRLSPSDMARAFAAGAERIGLSEYHSDGTSRGDSTAHIASVGMDAAEGGEELLGARLAHVAYLRGLPDPYFYHDYIVLMRLVRQPRLASAACVDGLHRWPDDPRLRSACTEVNLAHRHGFQDE